MPIINKTETKGPTTLEKYCEVNNRNLDKIAEAINDLGDVIGGMQKLMHRLNDRIVVLENENQRREIFK